MKADLILTSDWHLRETTPTCRIDDFWKTQWQKVMFINKLQREHDCPVLHAGDLFDHWKPSPRLLSETMCFLPDKFYTVYGQHDLPQHNFDEQYRSGIFTLEVAGKLTVLPGVHWGKEPETSSFDIPISRTELRCVLVWHKMIWQGKKLWPEQTDPSATAILKKYEDYDLILTGDNHKPFVEEYDGRLLVNPGSLLRQTAAQVDHTPRVYLYYADTNAVRPVMVPIQSGEETISRDHIDRTEEREGRITAFVERIKGEWDLTLSFEENLEHFFQSNKVLDSVKQIIYDAMDDETGGSSR